jgi:hypothetical protein
MLEWKQTAAFSRAYELKGEAGLVEARLEFPKLIGTNALAHIEGRVWEFGRHGNPTGRTSIRIAGSEQEHASFLPHAVGKKGEITWTAGGRRMVWMPTNLWETEWQWITAAEEGLVGLKRRNALLTTVEVHLAEWAAEEADVPMLVCLGLYTLLVDESAD